MAIQNHLVNLGGRGGVVRAAWFGFVVAPIILLIAGISGCATPPACIGIERVLAFGDSNVDTGNLFRLTGQIIPAKPRWQGRESNGPLVVEYLASALHASLESHAVSGATTGAGNIITLAQPQFAARFEGIKVTGLSAQVENFIRYGGTLRDSDLIVIWAGSNDLYKVALEKKYVLAQRITESAANLERVIMYLHEAGGRRMIIVNRTPRDLLGSSNDLAGVELNKGIAKAVKRVGTLPGVDIRLFDAYTAVSDMMRNPSRYGFNETVAWCMTASACVAEKFTNWDGAHKTTKVHRIMAEQMLLMVSPEKSLCRPTRISTQPSSSLPSWADTLFFVQSYVTSS
jgi:phospholipase/lecithinase/hemolysin